MHHFSTTSHDLLLITVPEGFNDFAISDTYSDGRLFLNGQNTKTIEVFFGIQELPTGNWKLLGSGTADMVTEGEAREIMDTIKDWDNPLYYNLYYNYNAAGRDFRDVVEAAFPTALASLSSLFISQGLEMKGTVIVYKSKK